MIIKNIEIISFGKFKNKTIEFAQGLNVICGNNESGKSTVMNFIFAMLYGFGDNRGKSASLREKYTPWDGGVCEGKLCALLPDGKEVTIYRKSGTTKKQDVLRIYETETGQELSVSCEELVGATSDTFLKTLCINQLSSVFAGSNDEIVQRLSNLSSGGDEDINFEKALKILDGARREIQPLRGNGGLLYDINSRISELEHKKAMSLSAKQEIEHLTNRLPQSTAYLESSKAGYEKALREDFTKEISHLCGRIEEKEAQLDAALHEEHTNKLKKPFLLSGICFAVLAVAGIFLHPILCVLSAIFCILLTSLSFTLKNPLPDTSVQEAELDTLRQTLRALEDKKVRHEKETAELKGIFEQAQESHNAINLKIKTLTHQLSMDSVGNLDALYEEKAALERRLRALTLAKDALSEAKENVQRNFTPTLNKKASSYFDTITGGKYERIFSDEQFNLTIDSDIPKKSELFSGGTIDQLYLSLRLALADMLFEDTPTFFILDQPFLQYDELRKKNAIELLNSMGKSRQVLLFSCDTNAFSQKSITELLT